MIEAMNDDDFRVLVRVSNRSIPDDYNGLDEFPYLNNKAIQKSLQKLTDRGWVLEADDKYMITYSGLQFLEKQSGPMERFYDELFQAGWVI